jgi:hypothetical protein
MHCVLCGRPACYVGDGWLPGYHIWQEVRACHPDRAQFPLLLCAEHKEEARGSRSGSPIVTDIIAVLKSGKTPSARRGLDGPSIPKRAVPFGALAVGARFQRLNRQGQPITATTYVRADTQPPGHVHSVPDHIHNAISFGKIDARTGGQPQSYVFDDWLRVMPID